MGAVPDDWLLDEGDAATPDQRRGAYVDHLVRRLAAPRAFVAEAEGARRAP